MKQKGKVPECFTIDTCTRLFHYMFADAAVHHAPLLFDVAAIFSLFLFSWEETGASAEAHDFLSFLCCFSAACVNATM